MSTKEKNANIDFIETEVRKIYRELKQRGKDFTANDLKVLCTQKPKVKPTFLQVFDDLINKKIVQEKKQSTIKCIYNHRKIFVDFLNTIRRKDIDFQQVGNEIVDKLTDFIQMKKTSNGFFNNAIYTYSAVFDRANHLGIIYGNPFKLVERKKLKIKDFIYLNNQQLSVLLNTNLQSIDLQQSLNAFLFQCYSGVSICDLKAFKKSINIVNDSIIINRKKNGQPCYIPIVKECKLILDRLKTDSFKVPFDNIYNGYTKIFATICEHSQAHLFTSHVGRKTHGMFLLSNDIRMETVQKVLGHSDIRVTQKIYTRIFNKDIDRDFQHLV